MASMRTVALCRKSLLVSSAGASLKKRAGLQVLELGEGHQPRSSRSGRARPMRSCPIWPWFGDWALQLLQARPDLLLVGVDLASDRALVPSSRPTRVGTSPKPWACPPHSFGRTTVPEPATGDNP
jgi:hypothetical protein